MYKSSKILGRSSVESTLIPFIHKPVFSISILRFIIGVGVFGLGNGHRFWIQTFKTLKSALSTNYSTLYDYSTLYVYSTLYYLDDNTDAVMKIWTLQPELQPGFLFRRSNEQNRCGSQSMLHHQCSPGGMWAAKTRENFTFSVFLRHGEELSAFDIEGQWLE